MELKGMLDKLVNRENEYSSLSAKEKKFINAYEKTLGDDATPKVLEKARDTMNAIDLTSEEKSKFKSMTMKDQNKQYKSKGGDTPKNNKKKDKIAVMIAVGKPKMAYGGSIKGKKHFYSGGGTATDKLPNKGTKALAQTEKGRNALRNMGLLKNGNKTT